MMRVLILAFVGLLVAGVAAGAADLPVLFTRHAQERVGERHIRRDWVREVLRAPEWEEPDPRNDTVRRAYGHVAEAGGQVLRVVYTDVSDPRPARLVITVFFDRDAERRRSAR